MTVKPDPGRIASSASQLIARAAELANIPAAADPQMEEMLARLIQALNTEAQLTHAGAIAMEQRLLRVLCNRLRMERDFAAHPQINDQPIAGPLFLIGGPRTGSTRLHKLLAASGDFLVLPFWQGHCLSLRTGQRDEDPAPRIAEAAAYIDWIDRNAPQAQNNHSYGTFEPEEEALIHEHFICSTFPSVFAHVPSFMGWWAAQDYHDQARFLRRGLQYLQWQFHDGDPRPWLLKCPIYHGLEPVLADVFPGLTFVTTNRHPVQTVASAANLVHGYRAAYSDADWRRLLGLTFLDAAAVGVVQHLAVRDSRPDLHFVDIGFTEMTRTPEIAVEKIYAQMGMRFSNNARRAIRDLESNKTHRDPGGQPYSLSDYGLTADMITHRFDAYIGRFSHLF